MKIGNDSVSSLQKQLLYRAKERAPARYLLEAFNRIIIDPDIAAERETVHPDWLEVFNNNATELKQIATLTQFRAIQEFIQKMSPIDPGVGDIDPEKTSVCFLLGAGASKPKPSEIPTVKELLPDMLVRRNAWTGKM